MKKGRVLLFLLVSSLLSLSLFSISLVAAGNIESEIQKLTHYAEEYEIGNINYVQLLVYTSAIRENLNRELGAVGKQEGGILKAEQIRSILGEPTEETKWVWVEGEEQERKLENYVPVWQKVIFDGKKIQMKLGAYPSIFNKIRYNENKEAVPEELKELEGKIIYRLNFNIEFKKPQEQLDIESKIAEIKSLAEIFNSNPSNENAEILAKESVNAEKAFESMFRQNPGKCEDTMNGIFGAENKRQMQKMLVNEINFYEGENFEAIVRLEMCDDCQWSWINVDLRLGGRGNFKFPKEGNFEKQSMKDFDGLTLDQFMLETEKVLLEIKTSLEQGDYGKAMNLANRLRALNEAWNQKANDVWKEIEKTYQSKRDSLTQQERMEYDQNYGWIKEEQERKETEKMLRAENYADRKQFYLDFFSSYEKREFYFEQFEWEKRLIEEFMDFGKEICDNNQDDNLDEQVDCADSQCGGKICGKGTTTISEGNETKEVETNYYCISGTCQAKQETTETKGSICGNHICEQGESKENCAEDCSSCPAHPPIKCSGKVIFKGKDENGCPLEPLCVEEEKPCSTTEDCMQPLCGVVECIKEKSEDELGKCKVTGLSECGDAACTDGTNKVMSCAGGEVITSAVCEAGIWREIANSCGGEAGQEIEGTEELEAIEERETIGVECNVREDCGGEDDVCSNGKCVTIPKTIEVAREEEEETNTIDEGTVDEPNKEETGEEQQNAETESPSEEQPNEEAQSGETESPPSSEETGSVILSFFRALVVGVKTIGNAITGFQTEGESTTIDTPSTETTTSGSESGGESPEITNTYKEGTEPSNNYIEGEQPPSGESGGEQNNYQEGRDEYRDENREEDMGRQREENKARCQKECNRPCVEKCIRDACGKEMDCTVTDEQKKCEGTCNPDNNCVEKCMKGGENWWQEFFQQEPDQKQREKGVFAVGGSCRKSEGKQEGFIWFNGWGDPFEQIQPLKNRYYQGGNADWCKWEIENLKKQRQEFERGFNEEFAKWFFEQYLASSAEEWEQAVSGIFEVYWKNVDNQMMTANVMQCLEIYDITEIFQPQIIEFKYDTEYGSVEYWEELKEVKIQGMDKNVKIVSPYMKVWIFPTEEFMKYEMKKAMENHEFPGSPEEKMQRENEEGLTEEEREMLKQDTGFMNFIKEVSAKYGGTMNAVVKFMDYEKNEVIFNLYVEVNEEVIMNMKPMLPSEVPEEDVTIEIDFAKIYDLIYFMEKEMRGAERQFPPWDRKKFGEGFVKGIVDGVKVRSKLRGVVNSATVSPESAKGDAMKIFNKFFSMMGNEGNKDKNQGQEQGMGEDGQTETENQADEVLGSKEQITAGVVSWR